MTTDGDGIDWPRLGRYVAGEMSPAEVAEIEQWIAAEPGRRDLVASVNTAWETSGKRQRHPLGDVDAAWTRMAAKVDAAGRPVPLATRPSRFAYLARIAAAAVVVAGGVWLWRESRDTTRGAQSASAQHFSTKPGERQVLALSDSTQVVLGVASELTVAAGYGNGSRDVTLRGEALFQVRHDSLEPFRVNVAGRVVEDLGTEFSVRAYDDADTVLVVVTSGSVALRHATATQVLVVHAGQTAALPKEGTGVAATTTDAESLLGWTRGQLVFDNTTMRDVAAELRRWYDVDVQFADSALASRHLTVTLEGERVDDALTVVATSLGARVERSGRTAVFHTEPAKR